MNEIGFLTLEEAKALVPGDTLTDTDGKRWKVNGAVQTWKRDASRIRVPLKHGLYAYGAITEADFEYDPRICTHVCRMLSVESSRALREALALAREPEPDDAA